MTEEDIKLAQYPCFVLMKNKHKEWTRAIALGYDPSTKEVPMSVLNKEKFLVRVQVDCVGMDDALRMKVQLSESTLRVPTENVIGEEYLRTVWMCKWKRSLPIHICQN